MMRTVLIVYEVEMHELQRHHRNIHFIFSHVMSKE